MVCRYGPPRGWYSGFNDLPQALGYPNLLNPIKLPVVYAGKVDYEAIDHRFFCSLRTVHEM